MQVGSCRGQTNSGEPRSCRGLQFVAWAEEPIQQIANHGQTRSRAGTSMLSFEMTAMDTTFDRFPQPGAGMG